MHEAAAIEQPDVLIDDEGEPIPERHVDHFERWKPAALALPMEEVSSPNVEGSLMLANCRTALENLKPVLARAEKIEGVDVEQVMSLESIAIAYLYAWAMWNSTLPGKPQPVAPLLKLTRKDRKLLLLLAEAAAIVELVAEEQVEKIKQRGQGDDTVQDLLALLLLLRKDGKPIIDSGVFVTEETLVEMEKRALTVDRLLNPTSAPARPKVTDEEREALKLLRDRFYSLLRKAHAEAELLAVKTVGIRKVRSLVPALIARKRKPKKKTDEPNE